MNITEKMVLGTAQFGSDYGIANIRGKPSKKDVFSILNKAWEKGIRRFDTAPGYGSEVLLGEFITANGLRNEAVVLSKIPSLEGATNYKKIIRNSLEESLTNLGSRVEVLFFHNSADSDLLQKNPDIFENLLYEYPVSSLGVSVYEPWEVDNLSGCKFELSFQFPFNVLDQRFERVSMVQGKRYARSIFLQGLLASANGLRPDVPLELLDLHKQYHSKLADLHVKPVNFAVSVVAQNESVDYFLIGVDSTQQLLDIMNSALEIKDAPVLDMMMEKTNEKWLDPRSWS